MKNSLYIQTILLVLSLLISCSDDDTFSTSWNNALTFECDTLSLDTCFSTIPTPHKKFLVYNNSGDGIRINNVRLKTGNQTGFRVNVNGTYLGTENGYKVSDLELRNKDSLRVFVELTSNQNGETTPQLVEDNLVFTLESGNVQEVNLKAWSWDANILKDYEITGDEVVTLSNEDGKPIVVYGILSVDTFATLNIMPGTTMYFHSGAGIDVKGSLKIMGEKDNEVTLRCDRFDWMVSNLSYDNNPGQWGGIHFYSCSYDNEINYCDMHAGSTALFCDSASIDEEYKKLAVRNTTIHNMKGSALNAISCNITIENTQLSNTQGNCLYFLGGNVLMNHCTVAQYYPFDSRRGAALFFTNGKDSVSFPLNMKISNSIIKGYADDVVTWSHGGTEDELSVLFDHCIVRTTPGEDYEYMFKDCIIEDDAEDTLTLARNSFVLFDTQNFFYDFTPKDDSPAIDAANPAMTLPVDRRGRERDVNAPDIGCYEVSKEETEETENDNKE